jgi:phage shock protein PspC (stress-responsive transcriptional regulator)
MDSNLSKPNPIRCVELLTPFAMWPLLILIGSAPIFAISLLEGIGEMFEAEPFFMSIAMVIFLLCLLPGYYGIRLLSSYIKEMKILRMMMKRADHTLGTFTLHFEFYPQTSLDYRARTVLLGVSDEKNSKLPEHHFEINGEKKRLTREKYDLKVSGVLYTFEGKPVVLTFPYGRVWFAQFHKHSSI